MSTPISLTVGGIELTSNTGFVGIDHGMLFQERDRQRRTQSSINYDYYAQHPELDPSQAEWCFCKTLGSMLPRLELLGYTLAVARAAYDQETSLDVDRTSGEVVPVDPLATPPLTFDEFLDFVRAHAVPDLRDSHSYDSNDIGPRARQGRFANGPVVDRMPHMRDWRDIDAFSERSFFGMLIGLSDPYAVLRVLAENPANLELEVIWDYGLFVHAGWAQNEEFVPSARRNQTYLIATEGSSDTHVLTQALKLLRSEIEDFFRFIDVENGHPFSGTGSLVKFAEGLVKIDIQNRVLFIFDNDAEGVSAHSLVQGLKLPANMRSMVLPSLDELRDFPARGPEGVSNVDINGRAAAIECYLDLRLVDRPPAQVTWTNFKEKLNTYQGSLDFKGSYVDEFFAQTPESISSGAYDVSKLVKILDAVVNQCSGMAAEMMLPVAR